MRKRKHKPYTKRQQRKDKVQPYPVTISFKRPDGTREKINGTVIADSDKK